jgi:lysophospholipid acyltransferase (LPLAT)-like uncharacterized protein
MRAGGSVARWLVSLLGATWRVQAHGREHLEELRRQGRPFIFALWHRHLLPLVWYHRGDSTSLLVSGHEDGSYLAHAARGWGYGLVRGSSTRGGVAAFRNLLGVLRRGGEVAVTPDGPRGPAGTVKLGVVVAAQVAGAAIIPVAAEGSSCWRLRSWDGFGIPKPFARVRIVYGAPLRVSREAARSEAAEILQQRLETVSESARC